MRLMVIGDSTHAMEVAKLLDVPGRFEVEHWTSAAAAERHLCHQHGRYGWVVIGEELDPASRARLQAASRSGPQPCVVSVLGEAPDGAAAQAQAGATAPPSGADVDELERWRNVLAFAARAPEQYPALRDALRGGRPGVVQFHAPCKRSA